MAKGMGDMMKQARVLQEKMAKMQEEMGTKTIEASAGGGMVKVTMNGKHEVRRVEIDESLVGDDREMLEDLIASACNDANRRIAEKMEQSMSGLTAGLNLPPGFKMPF